MHAIFRKLVGVTYVYEIQFSPTLRADKDLFPPYSVAEKEFWNIGPTRDGIQTSYARRDNRGWDTLSEGNANWSHDAFQPNPWVSFPYGHGNWDESDGPPRSYHSPSPYRQSRLFKTDENPISRVGTAIKRRWRKLKATPNLNFIFKDGILEPTQALSTGGNNG